jgi:hypothetical protein
VNWLQPWLIAARAGLPTLVLFLDFWGVVAMVHGDSVHKIAQTGFGNGTNELYDRSVW